MPPNAVGKKNIDYKILLYALLSSISSVAGLFDQCNHVVELQSRQKMYINSPYYPGQYPVGSSCRYMLVAPKDHQLKIKCNINLNSQSSSPRCTDEIFYFNREGSELLSGSEFFCGSTNVERKSFLNRAIISYISTPSYSRNSIESGKETGEAQEQNETASMSTMTTTTTTTTINMTTNLMTSTMGAASLVTVVKPDSLPAFLLEETITTIPKGEQLGDDVEQAAETSVASLVSGNEFTSNQAIVTPTASGANKANLEITTTDSTSTPTTTTTTTTTVKPPPAIFLTVTPNPVTSTESIKTTAAVSGTSTTISAPSLIKTTTSSPLPISANLVPPNDVLISNATTIIKPPTLQEAPTTTTTTPLMEIYTTPTTTTPAPLESEKAAPLNTTTTKPTSFLSYLLASMGWRSDFLRIPLFRISITPYRRVPYQGLIVPNLMAPNNLEPNNVVPNNVGPNLPNRISPYRQLPYAGVVQHGIPYHGMSPYRDVPYHQVPYNEVAYGGYPNSGLTHSGLPHSERIPYNEVLHHQATPGGVPYREQTFHNFPYQLTRIVGGNNVPIDDVVVVENPTPLPLKVQSKPSPLKIPGILNPLANTYGSSGGGSFSCFVEAVEPPCECGWSTVPKVAGQVDEAGINEFPSMAGVLSVKYNKVFCGATIIHHRYLISAAHCFLMPEAENAENIRIVVGEHDLSTVVESLYTRFYDIESIIIHENFVTTSNSVRNDIALLRTTMDIEWNRSVGPACLPFRPIFNANGSLKPPIVGQRLDTAGWGTTTFGGTQSTRLLKTTLDVIDREDCKRSVNTVPSGTFCTYTPGKDTCQYDSGGALYMRDSRLYAVGIVSYGFACASNQPSINTKISIFMKWIKSKTPEVNYCVK